MMKLTRLFFFLLFILVLAACSSPAEPTLLDYEQSLCHADSLVKTGAADSTLAVHLLADLHREYNQVKELSGGKRVRLMPSDGRKQLLWGVLTALLIGLNVWLSIGHLRLVGDRKHRRYLLDLTENERQRHNNECERIELEECLREMSLADDEREEVRQSLINLIEHGNTLHEENDSLRLRLKEYEKHPVPREVELLKKEGERACLLDEQVQTLTATLIDHDETMNRLRHQPKFLTDADWEHLRQLTDQVYSGFISRLTGYFPLLTAADLQLCLLMRLRFTNIQMATLTAVSPASVSQQKFRLKRRLLQMDETLFQNGETVDMVVCKC